MLTTSAVSMLSNRGFVGLLQARRNLGREAAEWVPVSLQPAAALQGLWKRNDMFRRQRFDLRPRLKCAQMAGKNDMLGEPVQAQAAWSGCMDAAYSR